MRKAIPDRSRVQDIGNYIKLRNKVSVTDIYYTYQHWTPREIDGVTFLPVVKTEPSHSKTQQLHYMRKDSLEKIK
jgi:hypothetical protein